MNATITDINPSRKQVSIAVSAEEAAQMSTKVTKTVAGQARVPGFRPGKAPAHLVETRFKDAIEEEYTRSLVQSAYDHLIKQSGLQVYQVVNAKPTTSTPAVATEVVFEVDLVPTIELPEYKGLSVASPDIAVSDADIDQAIEERRKALAQFEVVDRPSEKGDYVKLSYSGTIDGASIKEICPNQPILGDQKNTWEEAGAEDVPGVKAIAAGIIGVKVGNELTVEETFPADHPEAALAEKTAQYAITIHEVRSRVLPAVDDAEFLKHHAVETPEALRVALKARLEDSKKAQAYDQQANALMNILREKAAFELPESAIEGKMPEMVDRFLASEAARQASPEVLERDREKILAELRDLAARRLKDEFILEKVAELENLTPSEEDMQRGAWQEAMMSRTSMPDYVKQLQKSREKLRAFQRRMIHHKALEFLVKAASVTTRAPSA